MKPSRSNLPPLSCLLPFEAAARLESITKAAEELSLTQAAISKQIRVLEDNLGTPLFDRRNRAVYLTEEGRELRRIIRASLGDIAAACKNIRDRHSDNEIILRSQQCEAIYWLMPRLSKFYQEHPEIELRVSVSTRPISDASEDFDLALQSIDRNHGTAILVHHAEDEVFPVCSPGYLPSGAQSLSVDQLLDLRLLHHQTADQDWMTWDVWLSKLGIKPRVSRLDLVYDSYPMVVQAATEGHGIAVGWRRTCEHLLATGALIRPCADDVSLPDGLGLYVPNSNPPRPEVQVLLDWMIAELS